MKSYDAPEAKPCYVCKKPCVAGQQDRWRRAVHLGCQTALPKEDRNPRLAEYPTATRTQLQDVDAG